MSHLFMKFDECVIMQYYMYTEHVCHVYKFTQHNTETISGVGPKQNGPSIIHAQRYRWLQSTEHIARAAHVSKTGCHVTWKTVIVRAMLAFDTLFLLLRTLDNIYTIT